MEMARSGQINLNSRLVEGYGQVNYTGLLITSNLESYIHLIGKDSYLYIQLDAILIPYSCHGGVLSSWILQYPSNCTLIHAEVYRSS